MLLQGYFNKVRNSLNGNAAVFSSYFVLKNGVEKREEEMYLFIYEGEGKIKASWKFLIECLVKKI